MAQAGNQLKLLEVEPGFFWTRARALDLSEEDRAAVTSGYATEEQCRRLAEAHSSARDQLFALPAGVPVYGKPH